MSNCLSKSRKVAALELLCEGNSIRGTGRITGIHRGALLRMLVRYGYAAKAFMDRRLRNLPLRHVQVDELYTYVHTRQRNLKKGDPAWYGERWVFYGMDEATKLIPNFLVGKRDEANTYRFMSDLASRVELPVRISTDGWSFYPRAVEYAFGGDVQYGWVVKHNEKDSRVAERTCLVGAFNKKAITTSHVERCNGILRNYVKRCCRRTYCFSKKPENLEAAISLWVMHYNFVRRHGSLRRTPAMAAGVVSTLWSVEDMFDAIHEFLY